MESNGLDADTMLDARHFGFLQWIFRDAVPQSLVDSSPCLVVAMLVHSRQRCSRRKWEEDQVTQKHGSYPKQECQKKQHTLCLFDNHRILDLYLSKAHLLTCFWRKSHNFRTEIVMKGLNFRMGKHPHKFISSSGGTFIRMCSTF